MTSQHATRTAIAAPPAQAGPQHDGLLTVRGVGVTLLAAGLVGLAAAFVLAVEKFLLLTEPFYVPSCTINATMSCGPVMTSPQAEVFGFPNPLLGIAGFAVLTATGAALAGGAELARWYWAGLQAGVSAGLAFVAWLVFQSVFVIGALCPYCLAVWAATITAFWYVTLCNLRHGLQPRLTGRTGVLIGTAARYHSSLLVLLLVGLAALVAGGTLWGRA